MERDPWPTRQRLESGFSLVELVVVVGIIFVIAAVAIPNIGQYIRNYRLRGAAQEVASSIQEARTKAIMRNAQHGVSLVVVGTTTYRMIFDDPATPGAAPTEAQLGVLKILPNGVEFDVPQGGAPDLGVRFSRLGTLADYDYASPCKSSEDSTECSVGSGRGFGITVTGAQIRLVEPNTGLFRTINVAPGGRVQSQQ